MRWIALIICCSTSFFCAYFYDVNVNPGHGRESPYQLGLIACLGAAIWTWIVFPKMGRNAWLDVFLILAAFPTVGAIGGAFLGGIVLSFATALSGLLVAVFLPIQFPWPIGGIYLATAMIAFTLPRLRLE